MPEHARLRNEAPHQLPVHSILFVPGDRPDRFGKAMSSGASLVCIDLEDGVSPDTKQHARRIAIDYLETVPSERVAVRINALSTREGLEDLLAILDMQSSPATLLVPKVSSAADLIQIESVLGDCPSALLPIVETCEGLANIHGIVSSRRVRALLFGGADLAGEIGIAMAWEPLFFARARIVMACAQARVPALDVPYLTLNDDAGLAGEAARVKALGFSGKAAIHPNQVSIINTCFSPTMAEIVEAQNAIAAFEAGGRNPIRFNGDLLEAPIIRRYEAILAARREPADNN